jgi:hypothetical protein
MLCRSHPATRRSDPQTTFVAVSLVNKRALRNLMLNKSTTLKGYKLDSLDEEFGTIEQFYFDDRQKKHARLFNSGVWRIPLSPIVLRRGEAE